MRWFKWYGVEWINATARDELSPAERATFLDFVCLASFPGTKPGTFKFASYEALARKLNTPLDVITSTCDRCLPTRISVAPGAEGLVMTIRNWPKYQITASEPSIASNKPTSTTKTASKMSTQKRREEKRRDQTRDSETAVSAFSKKEVSNPTLTLPVSFSEWLEYLEKTSNKVGALVDVFKQLHSNAPTEDMGPQLGGRIAALYKLASKDYRRLLQSMWLAAATPIVGSHLSYIQGMVRKEGHEHGQRSGLRAPGQDSEQARPAFRSVTEEDFESGRARFDAQLHRVVWANEQGTSD